MYQFVNPNPLGIVTGDCVVRALSVLLDQTWDKTYTDLALSGFAMGLMPSTNAVHKTYLEQKGYRIHSLPSTCPNCITVREFADLFSKGSYLLAMGDHTVALINGIYYDIFDSGDEIVSYYFSKEKGELN